MRSLLLLLVLFPGALQRSQAPRPPSPSAAARLVRRLVALESAGQARRADSLVDWQGCVDGGGDALSVTRSAHIGPPISRADTVYVTVTYRTVGDLSSDDPHRTRLYVHFGTAQARTDTVTYAVVRHPQHLVVVCRHFDLDHVRIDRLVHYTRNMDTASLARWRAAGLPVWRPN